jgi:hypothetical protein
VTVADAIAANAATEQAILNDEAEDAIPEWDDLVWNTTDWASVFPDEEEEGESGFGEEAGKDAETRAAEQILAERMSRQLSEMEDNVDDMTEAELVGDASEKAEDIQKPQKRKKSRKLVIE